MSRVLLSILGLTVVAAALSGSGTAVAVAGLAGGVAGNLGTDLYKLLDRKVADRFLKRHRDLAPAPLAAATLRQAQTDALRQVLRRFDDARRGEDEDFSRRLSAHLDHPAVTDVHDEAIRDAVLAALPEAFDAGLAARRAHGEAAALQAGLDQWQRVAEEAVLAELRRAYLPAGRDLPRRFLAIFAGRDGWFALFLRDGAARLADDPTFAQTWQAEHLALIRQACDDNSETLARIEAMVAEMHASGIVQRAAAHGIPEPAVRAVVERLGGQGLARDDLVPWLDNWIAAAVRELGRRSNEGEAFDAALREAERRFRAGRLDDASQALMDELAREERREADRQAERRRHRSRLLDEAIRFDLLAFNIAAAVDKLRQQAVVDGVAADSLAEWLRQRASGYYEHGVQKGDNGALEMAVAVRGAILAETPRERLPLDWAMTQNNLGTALSVLGERESGTARLQQAVDAYHAALQEFTRERAPYYWDIAQRNLQRALTLLEQRRSGAG